MVFRIVRLICILLLPLTFVAQQGTEICDNAIDDDGDGLIDMNDFDCPCTIIEPISLIPNPSFEDLACCPDGRSQLNCAEGWIQASEPTTDLIHKCGWLGWDNFPPPQPFPDGDGIMGFRDGRFSQEDGYIPGWKEYAGACLLNPLQKDSTYKFQFDLGFASPSSSPPIAVTIFGTTTCDNLPFGVENPDLGCPTNGPGWQILGSRFVSGGSGNNWVKTNIVVTPPEDIAAIAIGPPCELPLTQNSLYYFFDNLILADINQFDLEISEFDHPCSDEYSLAVPSVSNLNYQWFKDGVALLGEVSASLSETYGDGDYQVRITESGICRISQKFEVRKPVIITAPTVVICNESEYAFGDRNLSLSGIYLDTFTSINNCDSIVEIELKVLGEIVDTVSTKIFKGDTYSIANQKFSEKGSYLLTLESSIGCDSLVLLELDLFTVYAPNIFSPNEDGFNDTFTILGESEQFTIKEMQIFDRWGNKIYNGTEWDGKTADAQPAREGIYTFFTILKFNNGNEELMSGSITLIR